ncbi:unnamed protein product [Urochloa humidicola]
MVDRPPFRNKPRTLPPLPSCRILSPTIMSLFALSSLVLPFLLLLLRCLSKRRLRHRANEEEDRDKQQGSKKSLEFLIQWHKCQIANVDAARREEAMEFLNKWGFVREGLQRPDLRGMDSYEIRVLEFLLEQRQSSSVLGIFGMRGVGKSTLLRLIHSSNYLYQHAFDYMIYLEVDDTFTVATFRDALAWMIGLDWWRPRQTSNAPLANEIISSRLQGKTFLLLLDDVRGRIDLEAIGLPMPLGHRQKVVFTTRDQAVCTSMGCAAGDTIHMQCLGEDDAWDLFRYLVGDKIISYDSEIEHLAKQMVAECRGIPSALCTVGLSMSNQSDCVLWRVAYEMLMIKPPLTNDIQDKSDEAYPRLKYFEDPLGDPLLCSTPSYRRD